MLIGSEDGELEGQTQSLLERDPHLHVPFREGRKTSEKWRSHRCVAQFLLPRPLLVWAVRSAVFRQGEGPGCLQVGRWPEGLRHSLRGPLESAIPLSVAWQCPM